MCRRKYQIPTLDLVPKSLRLFPIQIAPPRLYLFLGMLRACPWCRPRGLPAGLLLLPLQPILPDPLLVLWQRLLLQVEEVDEEVSGEQLL